MLVPVAIRKSSTCERCTMNFYIDLATCPHCKDLTDDGVRRLLSEKDAEMGAAKSLGYLFFLIAAMLAVLVLAINL